MDSVPGPEAGNALSWDDHVIGDWYPQPTTPLTFSFARKLVAAHYRNLLRAFGAREEALFKCRDDLAGLLGRLDGHTYYNLAALKAVMDHVPDVADKDAIISELFGELSKELSSEEKEGKSAILGYLTSLWGKSTHEMRSLYKIFGSSSAGSCGQREFNKKYQQYRALDFGELSLTELVRIYRQLEQRVEDWRMPAKTEYCLKLGYSQLIKMVKDKGHSNPHRLVADLLVGEKLESIEPIKIISHITNKISQDKGLSIFVEEASIDELVAWWKEHAAPYELERELGRLFYLYGERRPNEFELAHPNLNEEPRMLFGLIKRYLSMAKLPDMSRRRQRALDRRKRAEREVRELFGGTRSNWALREITIFEWLLHKTRANLLLRDEQRLSLARLNGLVGDVFRTIGSKLEEASIFSAADCFYLSVDEIVDFIEGRALSANIGDLAAIRREEFEHFPERSRASRLDTFGLNYFQYWKKRCASEDLEQAECSEKLEAEGDGGTSDGQSSEELAEICGQADSMKGVAGTVLRVTSGGCGWLSSGDILVANRADPGFAYFYPSVKALVFERGTALSHAVVIGREFGIPVLWGVKGAHSLRGGESVEVDGASGLVRRNESEAPHGT